MLLALHVVPVASNLPDLSKWLFAFEELENNLHPAMQRRLFGYLADFADKHKSRFFLTTHSHIVVDMFSQREGAQLIHVEHSGEFATAKTVSTFVQHGAACPT